MPYSSGSVTSFAGTGGLLDTLLTFLVAQGWTQLYRRSSQDSSGENPFGTDCEEAIISNTGLSGLESVMIGIREWEYPGGNAHGWDLNGYTWYNPDMHWNANYGSTGADSYSNTYEHYDQHPMLPLIDSNMNYWFFCNDQRIVVVVKVQSNYESCYLGFGRRFGNPSDYPWPLIVKGSLYGDLNYSDVSNKHQYIANNYWDQYGYPLLIVTPGGEYTRAVGSSLYTAGPRILPRSQYDASQGSVGPVGSRIMMTPVYIARPSTGHLYADMDGVYHVAAPDVQSEDTVTYDGNTYTIFQNVFRVTHYDFMAVQQ